MPGANARYTDLNRCSGGLLTAATFAFVANTAAAQSTADVGSNPTVLLDTSTVTAPHPPAPHVTVVPPAVGSEITSNLDAYYASYQAAKQKLQDNYNIEYSLEASVLPQWGTPHGGPPAVQLLYSPTITWTPFTNTAIGSGSFTFAFQQYQFWSKTNTAAQQSRMGLLTAPSGNSSNGYEYSQITYTHTMPGDWSWLSVSVGQYQFDNFDGNQYANSTQTNFINFALSQNGTQTYDNGGLGAYMQAATPDGQFTVAGGFQDATDILGNTITTRGYSTGKYAYFAYAQVVPKFLPGATYSVIWYSQPSVPEQPSASQGVSFSAVQNFGKTWGLFLRANNASGSASPIETSVAWGAIYNDPFRRNAMDQVGLGFFWSKANLSAAQQPTKNAEWGIELYYNYTIFKGLQLSPDVQFYVNPALQTTPGPAAMFTLRTTTFF
jgi:hypothetical protein